MLHNIITFLFLLFTSIASAAPIGDEPVTTTSNAIGYGTGGGIAGLIILILDIIVISKCLPSPQMCKSSPPQHTAKHDVVFENSAACVGCF